VEAGKHMREGEREREREKALSPWKSERLAPVPLHSIYDCVTITPRGDLVVIQEV
jgi:hypothetical protein